MKVRYYETPKEQYTGLEQALINRKIKQEDIPYYLMNTTEHINPPTAFDEQLLINGWKLIDNCNKQKKMAMVVVDCDVDGWTSSALIINFLKEEYPDLEIDFILHEGKQHGLNDVVDDIMDIEEIGLVICPDSATNDIESIEKLHNIGMEVLILDHHISDVPMSPYAITINSQYDYPNPFLSGVGVTYQFCRYKNTELANTFLDLVAIGEMGDMMDIRNLEVKELMFLGFKEENLHNPLIVGLKDKAAFALSKPDYAPSWKNGLAMTPMGAAFFIIPLLNALSRSGTIEEKFLVFSAMLVPNAFKEIPSNKRGHKPGEMEKVLDQALRTCTNVKNRQTRAEEAGMELLTRQAEKMLDNKVLVFCLEPGEIQSTIAGLVANKLQAKYQRPVCITFKNKVEKKILWIEEDEKSISLEDNGEGEIYQGSMRGYTATGIDDFKSVAETSKECLWCRGHENAAGICLSDPGAFVDDMNETLKDISTEIVYYVDYIWDTDKIDGQKIIDLANCNDYLGTGFPRPLVYIKDCEIDSYLLMKDIHLKINLPDGVSAIIWDADINLRKRLEEGEKIKINFIAKCNINSWNGVEYPQLIVEAFEEVAVEYENMSIAERWNF